jgi:hypothetical protein
LAGLAAVAFAAAPASVAGQAQTTPTAAHGATAGAAAVGKAHSRPTRAHLSVQAKGPHKGRLKVGHRSRAVGYLRPFVPGQRVKVALVRKGHTVVKRNPIVKRVHNKDKGRFDLRSGKLLKPGTYRVVAKHLGTRDQGRAVARSSKFRIKYPNLGPGARNSSVKLFNHLLLRQGYYSTHGRRYGSKTGFAVMAFRKVNGMKRTFNASPGIFKKLAAGKGSFNLKYPGAGKHVEVDISKQVMALANHGKAQHVFAVSTGAPATPTIRGHFHFYRKDPGYNSERMYYSVYFIRGYATHGYDPDPPYNASHGCVRNPIPDSIFIYNWISLGDSIWVYK